MMALRSVLTLSIALFILLGFPAGEAIAAGAESGAFTLTNAKRIRDGSSAQITSNLTAYNGVTTGDEYPNGSFYSLEVRAGTRSLQETATVPSAPQDLQASAGDSQISLRSQAPSSNGGAAITSYRVFRSTNGSTHALVASGGCANLGVILACTDTGLTNGQAYTYFVSAVNSAGPESQGADSNSVTVTPAAPASVPSAPRNLQASPGNTQNFLGWQTPSSNGGAAITSYRVFRGTTSSNQQLVTSGGCANLGVT